MSFTLNNTVMDRVYIDGVEMERVYVDGQLVKDNIPIPATPTNLVVDVTGRFTTVSTWDNNNDGITIGYKMYRDNVEVGDIIEPTRSYYDSNLSSNTSYDYQITAYNSSGIESSKSAIVVAWTNLLPPNSLFANGVSDTQIDITWNAVSGATGYLVKYSSGQLLSNQPTVNYNDTGLLDDTTYNYTVEGYSSNANGDKSSTSGRTLEGPPPPWGDVSTLVYDNKMYNFQSDNSAYLILAGTFNDTGSIFIGADYNSATIFSYNVSTLYDVSTMSKSTTTFSCKPKPWGVIFADSGTKMFIYYGESPDIGVFDQYALSTPYNISSAGGIIQTKNLSSFDNQGRPPRFSEDGTHMYFVGNQFDKVQHFTLSTPFSLSHAVLVDSTTLPSAGFVRDLFIDDSGTRLYINDSDDGGKVLQYNLSTPFDTSTVTYQGEFLYSMIVSGFTRGLTFKNDGSKFYTINVADGNRKIYQFSLG